MTQRRPLVRFIADPGPARVPLGGAGMIKALFDIWIVSGALVVLLFADVVM
jgi:hypothetical protein